jgi:PAS domain S-box-containing protein
MQDITEYSKLEEVVHLQAMVLDQIQENVVVFDANDNIMYCNYSQPNINKSYIDTYCEYGEGFVSGCPARTMTRKEVQRITLQDGKWSGEILRRMNDGCELILDSRMCIIRDSDGEIIAFCESSTDITERKRTSEVLRQESLRRKMLMQKSNDGIAIFDHEHRIIEANDSFAEMLGYTLQEIIGMHSWDFEAMLTREQILALPLTPITKNIVETVHRRKDGTLYDAEVSASSSIIFGKQAVFICNKRCYSSKNC